MPTIQYQGSEITYYICKKKIKNVYIQIKDGKVIVKAPNRIKESEIQKIIQKKSKWIAKKIEQEKKNEIQEIITPQKIKHLENVIQKSIQKYSNKLGVYPNKIRIKNIKYAWGSCSSNKNITINLNLANKTDNVIEYVVLHELCHLKEMNHSKKFWSLVKNCMEDYEIYKKQLK